MGRNLKPRHKASRRFGENIADTIKSPVDTSKHLFLEKEIPIFSLLCKT